jgi:pyruvate/2-oxoglutarate/acetoin dehydrogenase E1 component
MNGVQHIASVLTTTMAASDSVHLVGEALPLSAAGNELLVQHPERCHLLPAADATLVGVAIGLAISGKIPVVELSGPEALWGALQQLGQESAALSGEFRSTMVVRVPLGPGSMDPSPLFDGIPHIQIASPADPIDAGTLLQAALTTGGITVLLEPLTVLGDSGGEAAEPILGSARIVESGDHVTLAAWGDGVAAARKAARALRREDISAEVIDLRSLSPLDTDTLMESVDKTGRLVMVGASTRALLAAIETAFLRMESPPTVAGPTAELITSKARAAVHY